MTDASVKALQGLRDFSTLKWYVIPLLAVVLFIYATEVRKARASRNWDPVLAGLTRMGARHLRAFSVLDHSRGHRPSHHGGVEHRDHAHVRHRWDRFPFPVP